MSGLNVTKNGKSGKAVAHILTNNHCILTGPFLHAPLTGILTLRRAAIHQHPDHPPSKLHFLTLFRKDQL
jgi:hypothetical protein